METYSKTSHLTPLMVTIVENDERAFDRVLCETKSIDEFERFTGYEMRWVPYWYQVTRDGCDYELLMANDPNEAMKTAGFNALMLACLLNKRKFVEKLLRAGANVNLRDPMWGCTALCFCATSGAVECAKLLLSAGARLDAAESDSCALHTAICRARVEMIELFLERPEVSIHSPSGFHKTTPAMKAFLYLSESDRARLGDKLGKITCPHCQSWRMDYGPWGIGIKKLPDGTWLRRDVWRCRDCNERHPPVRACGLDQDPINGYPGY